MPENIFQTSVLFFGLSFIVIKISKDPPNWFKFVVVSILLTCMLGMIVTLLIKIWS
jgi:ABC-type multidrug transport system permease subunit